MFSKSFPGLSCSPSLFPQCCTRSDSLSSSLNFSAVHNCILNGDSSTVTGMAHKRAVLKGENEREGREKRGTLSGCSCEPPQNELRKHAGTFLWKAREQQRAVYNFHPLDPFCECQTMLFFHKLLYNVMSSWSNRSIPKPEVKPHSKRRKYSNDLYRRLPSSPFLLGLFSCGTLDRSRQITEQLLGSLGRSAPRKVSSLFPQ